MIRSVARFLCKPRPLNGTRKLSGQDRSWSMRVHDSKCLAQTVSKILNKYENLNVSHVTRGTPLLEINFNFLVSTGLTNNCTKFEACSFSHCENTLERPNMHNLEKIWRTFARLRPPPMKGFLYSCFSLVRQLSARAMLTLGFDTRSHFAAVSEFVEAGWVENRNFWTFLLPNPHPTEFRDQSLIFRSSGRGACAWNVCLRLVAAVYEKWPVCKQVCPK